MFFSARGVLTPSLQCQWYLVSLFGLWENSTKGWVWPRALEWSTGSLLCLSPDSLGWDPVLKILHMKIFQGGAEERLEGKKGRTAQTAGWGGKGTNGRDSGGGLLLITVPMGMWGALCCWESCAGSFSSSACSVSPALLFSLYCFSRNGGRKFHVGTGKCMMEISRRLVHFGAAADVFCCHISVTSKKLQGWKGP